MHKRHHVLALVLMILFVLTACEKLPIEVKINFDSNGGTPVESVTFDGVSIITIPENPTKEGYVFMGWYWDNITFQRPFTISSFLDESIQNDLTVYAKWVNQDEQMSSQLQQIYQLALWAGAYSGTYEQWIESIRGPQGAPGEAGKTTLLRINEGFIEWQREGDPTWTQLLDLNTLKGSDGISGRAVVFQVSEGYIQWQYVGDSSWTNLVELSTLVGAEGQDGTDGREVVFQVSEGYIQWQYVGDETWVSLIEVATLTGKSGVGISR